MDKVGIRKLWIRENLFLGMSFREYIKSNFTLFNFIASVVLILGIPVMAYRIIFGLGPSTNLSDTNPWGIWVGFDIMTGEALAVGGFVMGVAFHLFGMKEFRPLVRPALLSGFLGYFFAIIGLLFDLGRYYRLPYPMFVSFGIGSVLFLIAWLVFLYLSIQFVELSPAIFEWLNMKKFRQWALKLTIGATIFGAILATLHQSALGGLLLLMPSKIHPLWYSSFMPLFFFVSAIIGGISMIIVESMLSHRVFKEQIPKMAMDHTQFDHITIGLGKAASVLLFTYFFLKLIGVAHGNNWHLINTKYGYWWLVEVIGFVLIPAFLYAWGVRNDSAKIVRITSIIAVIGIALNRLNQSIICFNWNADEQYYPHWMEIVITITIITIGLITFRWIINRMPILYDHPDYEVEH
ncbi:MAG: NrfD/PsrC family molybdoenzyme membrane anchor subunit [bacterium]|nr:NrfD/PsrC family molybdoenzyme membrane anchor subunit [bacterium]